MVNPVQLVENIKKKHKKNAENLVENEKEKQLSKHSSTVIQLPIWPEPTRGMPNTIARSGLFTVRFRKTMRLQRKKHKIAALANISISYTGEELRQDDETVFMQLLHLAQNNQLDEPIRFTPYSFLKIIKWPTSGSNHYVRLIDCIQRMNASTLNCSSKLGPHFDASLVRKFAYEDESTQTRYREWVVWLEPEIINLFKNNDYSRVEWEQRLMLKKPVAQWLHTFYTGHEKPFPMKVETIMRLCESASKTLSGFRQTLVSSLDSLIECNFLKEWHLDDKDKVHVVRYSQKKKTK